MQIDISRKSTDWLVVENELGFQVNDNYKEFYETLGAIELDEYLYIIGLDARYNVVNQTVDTLDAYNVLKEYLDEELVILPKWLPVGYTIDGSYVFCSDDSVMIVDGGFEKSEVYNTSLLRFVSDVMAGKITSKHLVSGIGVDEHRLCVMSKQTF